MKIIKDKQEETSQESNENLAQQQEFFVQDSRSLLGSVMMFWKQGGGYTSDLNKAEVFTRTRALRQNQCRETDKPWPADYLRSLSHPIVDMQLLRGGYGKLTDDLDPNTPCVAVISGKFDGNSIFYIAEDGAETKNLDKARVYDAKENDNFQKLKGLTLMQKKPLQDSQFMVVNEKDCKKSMKLTNSSSSVGMTI